MITFTPMSIGKEIRNERKRQLMTQIDFAKKCGFSQKQLSEYENNSVTPTLERLELMASVLGKEWKLIDKFD